METNLNTGRFQISKLTQGVSIDAVMAETGFQPDVAEKIEEVKAPTSKELRILREEVDPNGLYFKKK